MTMGMKYGIISTKTNGGFTMETKKIILDTDLGGDCDDVGAVAVLCNLAKAGKADIRAVTYCIGNPWGGYFVRHELDYLGFGSVPVGTLKDDTFMTDAVYEKYSRAYVEGHHLPTKETEDAVRVLRHTLAENGGVRDITLVAIGPLRNIANLLRSGADDVSPKSGAELIRENVTEFVTMLGNFADRTVCEWNVQMDIPSAQYVIDTMPVRTVFSPFELGATTMTGSRLTELPEGHPVREAYYLYLNKKSYLRNSWDLITVYCAVLDDNPFYERIPIHAKFADNGCILLSEGDDMAYLKQICKNEEIVSVLDGLMLS